MKLPGGNRVLPIAALTLIVVVFYATAAGHFSYTPDDTYIYLRFAKNVAAGEGMSFNPGRPVYGFTGPLWMFVIAGGIAGSVDPLLAAKVVDLLCASLALLVLFFLAYELARDTIAALAATACFSFDGWFLRWTGTGMESSLAVLLVLGVFLAVVRNRYLYAVVLLAFLAMTRPEAVLLLPFVLADLVMNSRNRKYALNKAAALLLGFGALMLPWVLAASRAFGSCWPNTASAKSGFLSPGQDIPASLRTIGGMLGATEAVSLALIIFGAAALIFRLRHRGEREDEASMELFFLRRQTVLCGGWCITLAAFYVVSDMNVVTRYLLLIIPIIVALGFSLGSWALYRSRLARYRPALLLILMLAAIGGNEAVYRGNILPGIRRFEAGMETSLIPIAEWFRGNVSPGTAVVAADIGAIGYIGNVDVWDPAGLITPEALPLLRGGRRPYDIVREKLYERYIRAAYVVDRAEEPARLKDDSLLVPVMTKAFEGMSLAKNETYYYTVYRVRNAEPPAQSGGKKP